MKKILVFIFIVSSSVLYSQDYSYYTIDFETPNYLTRLVIDTISNPNNIWQIGGPQKNIFTSAYSVPNAIVTDTINSYPINDTSEFVIKHVSDELGGFQWPHTVILSGQYQVNSDTINDFGMIEFSPNNGSTWINLLTDTEYYNQGCYQWSGGEKPILTGNSNGWINFDVWLAGFGLVFNILPGDTVLYKFSFISDDIQTDKDGLIFDDLHFEDWAEYIPNNSPNAIFSFYPNPAKESLTLTLSNGEGIQNTMIEIYNLSAQLVKQTVIAMSEVKKQSKAICLNISDLQSGVYFVKVGKQMKKLIIE